MDGLVNFRGMCSPRPMEERRRRIRRWLNFRGLDHTIESIGGDGTRCDICTRFVEAGQSLFVITFRATISLHLDGACMDLWWSEIASQRDSS